MVQLNNQADLWNVKKIKWHKAISEIGQPLSFFIYNLTLEHSDPLAKNFLAVLSGGGQVLRHRIAFYSEAEGNEAVEAISRLGAQVVTRKLIPQPRGPKTERDFLIARYNENLHQLKKFHTILIEFSGDTWNLCYFIKIFWTSAWPLLRCSIFS